MKAAIEYQSSSQNSMVSPSPNLNTKNWYKNNFDNEVVTTLESYWGGNNLGKLLPLSSLLFLHSLDVMWARFKCLFLLGLLGGWQSPLWGVSLVNYISSKKLYYVASLLPTSDLSFSLSLGFWHPLFVREILHVVVLLLFFMINMCIKGEGTSGIGV